MVVTSISFKKVDKDILGVWLNSEISEVVSIFSHGDTFTQAMINVGLTKYLGMIPPDKDQMVCG